MNEKFEETPKNMANERITEGIVRDHFKEDALFKSIKWEEQKSSNKRIIELLKGESKGGGKGNGYPEFIISFPSNSNYIIVVECKATVHKHESNNRDKAKDYAVDGVLHYARALKDDFNVVAIAVSGQDETELLVSHFYWKKNATNYAEVSDSKLLHIEDYMQIFDDQFFISDFYTRDIAFKARELNEEFHLRSITEDKRCTMVSGMLLALIDEKFTDRYESIPTTKELGLAMLTAIAAVFDAEEDIVRNKSALIAEFSTLLNEPLFAHETINNTDTHKPEDTLSTAKYFISYLQKFVFPLIKHSNIGYDVLGRFYIEFIRYAQSQQKQGLVLTPPHITELFCDLADLRLSDVIYDPCCGTGGFLVSSMQRMFKLAGNDISKRKNIRQHQICGVEIRPAMYTYACSNMRFRGDGKSNLYNGDCFLHEQLIKENHKPTVAFLNPPYDVGCAGQMKFVEHALNTINPQSDGRVVAVVQMSCAIKDEKDLKAVKARILKKHHLKALLSMPDDLFYPVGVVTCIMVFEANKPNKGRKTWFGYFKDDGFEKRKHLGRIDARNRYTSIKECWLAAYKNQEEIAGLSVKQEITINDEWCAEAYMETDYSTLCDEDFIRKMRDYAAFRVGCSNYYSIISFTNKPQTDNKLELNTRDWQWFRYDEVFEICKGFYNKKPEENVNGDIPFIGATDSNNGITSFHDLETIELSTKTGDGKNAPLTDKVFAPNCITVSNNGSVGYAFYQPKQFTCTHDVNPLYLNKKWGKELNVHISMFLCTIIEMEQFRWAYGRKWRPKRMPASQIKLPAIKNSQDEYEPDWQWMEYYIKGLPYSGCL